MTPDMFKTGETVALRSGGAVMTVRNHIDGEQALLQGWPEFVMCEWLDTAGQSHKQRFHPDQIERVQRWVDCSGSNQPVERYWAFADGFKIHQPEIAEGAQGLENTEAETNQGLKIANIGAQTTNDAA